MTLTQAAWALDEIRNNRTLGSEELIARLDKIGAWLAVQKNSKRIFSLLEEAHRLHEKLNGGSGKGGIRIKMC